MPNMSFLELLFALLLVAVVGGTVTVAVLVTSLLRRSEAQAGAVAEMRSQLAAGGQSPHIDLRREARHSEGHARRRLAHEPLTSL